MSRFFYTLSFIAFFCAPLHASETDTERLRKGEVVTHLEDVKGSFVRKGITNAVIDAPFEATWNAITDYGHYKEFMPRIEVSDILTKTETEVRYYSMLDMPFPISDVSFQCQVKMDKKKKHIEFEMVQGTQKGVKAFNGTWDFEPFEGNEKRTLAKYNLFFEPEKGYPPWAVNIGTKYTIGRIMDSVRKRVNGK